MVSARGSIVTTQVSIKDGITPLSSLFSGARDNSLLVAKGEDRESNWFAFERDVGALAAVLRISGNESWLVAEMDPYALAVGIFAALHANCRAVLPANHQPGHLDDLATKTGGVITSVWDVSYTSTIIPTFGTGCGNSLSKLEMLDLEKAEIVLHTSGTTGDPVSIRKPLRCLDAEVTALHRAFSPAAAKPVLATVPPYHIYGLLFRILWPLASARPIYRDLISYPEELVSAAEREPGATLVTSPAFLKRALPVLELTRLKKVLGPVFSSGGPLPSDVAATYNAALSKPVAEVYGSTETGGIAFRSVFEADEQTPWQPLPTVAVRLESEQHLVAVRSPFLPEDGWYLSSDRARFLPDGRFILEGRADRIVKLEEQRVSLSEVERRLVACSSVNAARVVRLPDEVSRRQVLAAVIEPSATGWEALARDGKPAMRRSLQEALNPYLTAVVMPKRWRFVTQIPEDERGKTTDAALIALLMDNQGRRIEPVVLERQVTSEQLSLDLTLPRNLFYFEGHFDETQILPGVVQVSWAVDYAQKHFAFWPAFRRVEALKFFKVLHPDQRVTLDLEFNRQKGSLKFSFSDDTTKYSSGRIIFAAAS